MSNTRWPLCEIFLSLRFVSDNSWTIEDRRVKFITDLGPKIPTHYCKMLFVNLELQQYGDTKLSYDRRF